MKKITKLAIAGLTLTCGAAASYWWYDYSNTANSHHGHGKKQLACDMSTLDVVYQGKTTSLNVKEYISLDPIGLVHELGKKIKRHKVRPMVQLLEEYPDSQSITFSSCDAEQTLVVATEVIKSDPFNYLLSLNNRKRARLATYELTKKRAKYRTTVKNLVRIEIN